MSANPAMAVSGGSERIVFANQLRGFAACCVLASHLIGQYWGARDFAALATCTPVQPGAPPPVFALVADPWFQPGPFGVALFFLISGLVIPFSLDRYGRTGFLLARLLRIYPTYWAATLISLCLLRGNAAFWQLGFPYGWHTILANLLLIHQITGDPGIDLVNWTLCIELEFYLLMAVLYGLVKRAPLLTILLAALALTALRRQDASDLVVMLIGTLFQLRLRRRIGHVALVCCGAALAALFALQVRPAALCYNYGYALMLFALLFALRRLDRPRWLPDALAAISYPLYLVHFIAGFSVLKLLTLGRWSGLRLSYEAALVVAVLVAVGIATLLHYAVELPSLALGRRLTRR